MTPSRRAVALIIEARPTAPLSGSMTPEPANGPRSSTVAAPAGARAGRRWLLVRRPDDDEDLPGIWGLPAGSLAPGETEETLIRRIGRDKLGVTLIPLAPLHTGHADRLGYRLLMTVWTAAIESGTPTVPQPAPDVTQYADCDWLPPTTLRPGATAGSLCCHLALAAPTPSPSD